MNLFAWLKYVLYAVMGSFLLGLLSGCVLVGNTHQKSNGTVRKGFVFSTDTFIGFDEHADSNGAESTTDWNIGLKVDLPKKAETPAAPAAPATP